MPCVSLHTPAMRHQWRALTLHKPHEHAFIWPVPRLVDQHSHSQVVSFKGLWLCQRGRAPQKASDLLPDCQPAQQDCWLC